LQLAESYLRRRSFDRSWGASSGLCRLPAGKFWVVQVYSDDSRRLPKERSWAVQWFRRGRDARDTAVRPARL